MDDTNVPIGAVPVNPVEENPLEYIGSMVGDATMELPVTIAPAVGLRAETTFGGVGNNNSGFGPNFGPGTSHQTSVGPMAFGSSSGGIAQQATPTVMVPHPMTPSEKPEKFTGVGFGEWQQKMFFYLTTLNLVKYLSEVCPIVGLGEQDVTTLGAVHAWKHGDFLCRNYILNCLVDNLYRVYSKLETSKQLWESLAKKYKTEDAGSKKHIVAKFLDFKMIDSKSIMSQVQDLQIILHDIYAEGMTLSEAFQVAAVIEKLPPNWIDFKNYLKYKRKEMSLEDLIVRLKIEENNRKATNPSKEPKANLVETSESKNQGKRKRKRKRFTQVKGK